MPFKSAAQRAYFNTHKKELEKHGVNVNEWNEASKGQHDLPEHVSDKKKKPEKTLRHTTRPRRS
ncbi:MAG: hypothetical protein ACREQ5_12790 [Candidatus Dormibacteria bacterium]